MEPRRIFLSYSRDGDRNSGLVAPLRDALSKDGHGVFVDTGMPLGEAWAERIAQELRDCDHMIVLMSEPASRSEFVREEVRRVFRARGTKKRPPLLVVRVKFSGDLGYELSAYLGSSQHVAWQSSADTAEIIRKLREALAAGGDLQGNTYEPAAASQDATSPPQPSADLRRPGGTQRIDDPLYVARAADADIASAAPHAETVVIQGPRQVGKSSLLARHLQMCRAAKRQTALVDLSILAGDDTKSYPAFLQRIAIDLARQLVPGVAVPELRSHADLTYFFEDRVFPAVPDGLTLAFDEADRAYGKPFQGDFFTMLRLWHNHRALKPETWGRLGMAMAISTEPHLLIEDPDRSPFNVGVRTHLTPFSMAELTTFHERARGGLHGSEMRGLSDFLGGQPFLSRLALWALATGKATFADLLAGGDDDFGLFGDHLRSLLSRLNQELRDALRRILKSRACDDLRLVARLRGAGLVVTRDSRVEMANGLYARFFKRVLR